MKNKWFLVFFSLIFLAGCFLRFYQLGSIPGSLDWDEVSFGYNAYSVLHIGKDEYGESYPLIFRAFGEYKQPVYAYLDVVSVGIFGLTAFAVRFPSAFFGSVSIIFVYLLTYEIFRKYRFSRNIAFFAMAYYAFSPWSIQFSRIGFESNVATCLIIIGAWLFLRGLFLKKYWYFYGAVLVFCLSELTYISLRLITPFLFIAFLVYGFSLLKKKKFSLTILILIFVIGSGIGYLNTKSLSRGQDVLFTNQQTQLLRESVFQFQAAKEHHDIIGEVIYNRRVVYVEKFITNYLSHFNPQWLFITGESTDRHHPPGMGNLYLVSFPLIILGTYFLLTQTLRTSWIIFFWFLVAPLASSLTSDAPSALRSLIFLPTWQIFEATGLIYLFQMIKKRNLLLIVYFIVLSLYTVNVSYYLQQYFVYTNKLNEFQKAWQYGYGDAVLFADKYSNRRVVFSKKFEQPYIFYLFYSQYDPAKYISSGGSWRISKNCFTIDNTYFGDCISKLRKGDIFIVSGTDASEKGKILKKVSFSNGEPAVTIYQQ